MNTAQSQQATPAFRPLCGSDAVAALPGELNRVGPLSLEGLRC
jgi:hypothetical protein